MADDDLDFDSMTDDEIIAYLMRSCGISRREAARNWRQAQHQVQAAVGALLGACAAAKIEATGINAKSGKREVVPPHAFKARV